MESPAHFNRIATEEGTPIIAVGAAIGMTGIYLAIEHNQKKNGTDKIEHVEKKHDSAGKE